MRPTYRRTSAPSCCAGTKTDAKRPRGQSRVLTCTPEICHISQRKAFRSRRYTTTSERRGSCWRPLSRHTKMLRTRSIPSARSTSLHSSIPGTMSDGRKKTRRPSSGNARLPSHKGHPSSQWYPDNLLSLKRLPKCLPKRLDGKNMSSDRRNPTKRERPELKSHPNTKSSRPAGRSWTPPTDRTLSTRFSKSFIVTQVLLRRNTARPNHLRAHMAPTITSTP